MVIYKLKKKVEKEFFERFAKLKLETFRIIALNLIIYTRQKQSGGRLLPPFPCLGCPPLLSNLGPCFLPLRHGKTLQADDPWLPQALLPSAPVASLAPKPHPLRPDAALQRDPLRLHSPLESMPFRGSIVDEPRLLSLFLF